MTVEPQHTTVLKVATMPNGVKDVADLLQSENGPAMYEAMIRNARPATSWMIDHLDTRHDLTQPQGKVDACADIVDVLLGQPPVARAAYVKELSEKLGVPERDLRMQLNESVLERGLYYDRHPQERPVEIPRLEDVLDLS